MVAGVISHFVSYWFSYLFIFVYFWFTYLLFFHWIYYIILYIYTYRWYIFRGDNLRITTPKLFTSHGSLGDPPTFHISVIWRADFARQRRANCWSRCLCCAARRRWAKRWVRLCSGNIAYVMFWQVNCGELSEIHVFLWGTLQCWWVKSLFWLDLIPCFGGTRTNFDGFPTDRPLRGGSDKLFRLMRNWSTWRPILSSFNGHTFQQKQINQQNKVFSF